LDKTKEATHRIICIEKDKLSEKKYVFLCFTTKIGESYKISPPFDFANVEDIASGKRLVLSVKELNFIIEQIK
jgi:hypothetical protein